MEPLLIGIVDDHKLFTNALASLINNKDEFSVVMQASSGADFQTKMQSTQKLPQVILMDLNLGDSDGVTQTKWCKDNYPDIHVLALSVDNSYKSIIRMLKIGASGYLLKDTAPEQFIFALKTVSSKGFYHSDLVSEALLQKLNVGQEIELKEKEREFLQHVCSDKTYKEIAAEMYLSPKTIDKYREALFQKFDVKSRTALALYGIKKGYVEI